MNYKETLTKSEWFRLNGVYYGYPKCCIDNFIAMSGINFARSARTIEQNKVHQNNGFIPCPVCAANIVAGKNNLQDLIKNRFCPEPFPNDGRDEDKDHFVSILIKDFHKINRVIL